MSSSCRRRAIIWFRHVLRLADHDAVASAIEKGYEIVPAFIWAPEESSPWEPGGASRWWLHYALEDFEEQLRALGGRLVIRRGGDSHVELSRLIEETGAQAVFWNRCYEPSSIARDGEVKKQLRSQGLEVESFNSTFIHEPGHVQNKSGKPFRVFTPFWKHLLSLEERGETTVDLGQVRFPKKWPKSISVDSLTLLPRVRWDQGMEQAWTPTREGGLSRLREFGKGAAARYGSVRDFPAEDGTSQLSPYLHFGQLGPREMLGQLRQSGGEEIENGVIRQLYWREFAHHLLFHFPETEHRPLRPEFELFPWDENEAFLNAWRNGETGYPIVDAGMRQLWQTGWMHNRVRMIVASVLVKHLLQHWVEGSRWFWDTLVDADLANNSFGWQWTAGCGADAAPYFRVFNPIIQGEKFDPKGDYVRRFVPKLGSLPARYIHKPWELGELDLRSIGVTLGREYPAPLISHAAGRKRALDAFAEFKAIRLNEGER